jgi:hypothetical protein
VNGFTARQKLVIVLIGLVITAVIVARVAMPDVSVGMKVLVILGFGFFWGTLWARKAQWRGPRKWF